MAFLPEISGNAFLDAKDNDEQLFELLATPLHEGLYHYGSFDFMDKLSDGQQMLLAFDYLRAQVGQGGFIQFLHNGYVGLLPELPRQLNMIGETEMAQLIDDVLKLFVDHHEVLLADISPQDFAKLYTSLPAFVPLDKSFEQYRQNTEHLLMEYARQNITQFASITA